jgi:hypothetical protein
MPNIDLGYLGLYPVEKCARLGRDEFLGFVLQCCGGTQSATGDGVDGFGPSGKNEPILVGPADPEDAASPSRLDSFCEALKRQIHPEHPLHAKIIAWSFDTDAYVKIHQFARWALERGVAVKVHDFPASASPEPPLSLPLAKEENKRRSIPGFRGNNGGAIIHLEIISLASARFRELVLQNREDARRAEILFRFLKNPWIGKIRIKSLGAREFELEALEARSNNEGGWLTNCQWDFDHKEARFAAHPEYILSRKRVKTKGGGRFEAVLKARHQFPAPGIYKVACRVQDNFDCEVILTEKVRVE